MFYGVKFEVFAFPDHFAISNPKEEGVFRKKKIEMSRRCKVCWGHFSLRTAVFVLLHNKCWKQQKNPSCSTENFAKKNEKRRKKSAKFFSIVVFGKSHSTENPLGFFNIRSVAKYQKNEEGTLWRHLKIFEKSHMKPKKGGKV